MGLISSLLLISSCGDDDDPISGSGDLPVSSFQFQIDETNFQQVTFTNFSTNADSYSWDFGDGNTSTEENPVYVYDASGTFTVVLTATNSIDSRTSSKDVTITDPNEATVNLTGDVSKVWKLSRNIGDEEYPLVVGPVNSDEIWWAFGLNDPIGSRPCIMEEEYIFAADGTYTYDSKGLVFADFGVWNEDSAGQCVDDSDPAMMTGVNGDDLSAWGSGTFTFDFDPSAGTLTVNGLGAHVGLPKVGTDAEYGTPQNSVTYQVLSLDTDGPVDKMILQTSIPDGNWRFALVSYDNPADEPDLPGAPPTTSFGFSIEGSTVSFDNTTLNGESYSWDFGDGNMSSEESPTHTYGMDGSYNVVLTATNSNGSSTSTANIVISNSVFSADAFHGGATKTWKLKPVAAALGVGPGIGSSEWFATSEDDFDVRACTFDDTYTFGVDGSFEYNTNGDLWAEPYMGVDPSACISEDMLPADAAAWGSGSHTFEVIEGTGGDPSFITVTGTGAFIALPKAINGGEYAAGPPDTDGSITYQVLSYINEGDSETLVLTIDISEGETGTAYWTYILESE